MHDDRHTVSGGAMSFGLLMTMPRAAMGGNPGCTQPPPAAKATAPPRSRTRPWLVYTLPPSSSPQSGWLITVPFTASSIPVLDSLPTFDRCELGQPMEGI